MTPRARPLTCGIGVGFAASPGVVCTIGPDGSWCLDPPFEVSLPPPPSAATLSSTLRDVADMVHCLSKSSRLPDRISCRAWLASVGGMAFAASAHPYGLEPDTAGMAAVTVPVSPIQPGRVCVAAGRLHVPGAAKMLVCLDKRSVAMSGSSLELRDRMGRVLAFAGPLTSTKPYNPDDVCEWLLDGKDHVTITDDTVYYRFEVPESGNPAQLWGFALTASIVAFKGDERSLRTAANLTLIEHKRDIETLVRDAAVWTPAMDAKLVEFMNDWSDESGRSAEEMGPLELRPTPQQLKFKYELLAEVSVQQLYFRAAVVRNFNASLARCMELLDVTSMDIPQADSVSQSLRSMGHVLFSSLKSKRLEDAIELTSVPVAPPVSVQLDNMKAMASLDKGIVDPESSECLFVQAFHQLPRKGSSLWRSKIDQRGRLFNVKYVGEDGADFGGVFRDAMTRMVEDCFSSHLDLFLLTPNGIAQQGVNTDKYLPNPRHTSPRAIAMFELVGKIMGCSLRLKMCLPFHLPLLIWKLLVGQKLEFADLEAVDATAAKAISSLRRTWDPEEAGVAVGRRFTVTTLDGREVELKRNGAALTVTSATTAEYCHLLEKYKLSEFDVQVDAIRRGLLATVPERAIRLLTGQELDVAVAGRPDVSADVLEKHTEYEGYRRDDPTVVLFWKVFRSMSNEDRALFVRFAWGRSRLPLERRWPKTFKIQRRVVGDDSLPLAHTCFFSIELPPYSTEAIMRQRLLTAIHFGIGGILNL